MKVQYLGDVHLGKKFENGVPLHRRGEREKMQLEQFRRELLETKADLHIQVGDLFDKFHMPLTVIWAAAQAYIDARAANPDVTYALLRGNHDDARDADRVSAFKIFTEIVRPYGVVVADNEPVRIQDHVLIPWHPFFTAEEMVARADLKPGDISTGHWDLVMGDTNQIPAALMQSLGVSRAVTGHDHNKRVLTMDGLDVEVTGSMQPYSHAEDADGALYVTKTLAEVLADPDGFKDKCLRILMEPGQVLDQQVDCLQLTIKKVGEDDQVDLGEVDFEEFDLNELFNEAREQVGLDEDFGKVILERLEAERAAAN